MINVRGVPLQFHHTHNPAWCVSLSIAVQAALASAAQTPSAAGRLPMLLTEDWTYWVAEYPETATALVHPGDDARGTDYAPAVG